MSHEDSSIDLDSGYEGVAEFYDIFADTSDLPFYVQYARKQGSPILDLAAGTGRVTFELARNGFEVTALEKSPSMLAVARRKHKMASKETAPRVTLVKGCMTDFALREKFALVIIPASFGHALSSETQLSTLRCIKNHLLPDGLFILDLYPGAMNLNPTRFEDPPASLPDGRVVTRSGRTNPDPVAQILRMTLAYEVQTADGEHLESIEVESGVSIIYNREADLLVRMSGFEAVDELGSFKGGPYHSNSKRRILVLRHQ
ncbi:MAG: class I SAM-dependent methyltransferase [Candidatus Hermodarchaeota archaeon]